MIGPSGTHDVNLGSNLAPAVTRRSTHGSRCTPILRGFRGLNPRVSFLGEERLNTNIVRGRGTIRARSGAVIHDQVAVVRHVE